MKRFQAKFAGVVTAVVLSTTAFASSESSISLMGQAGIGPIIFAAQVGASNNDALLLLLDQFTALRGEMETLRGMVEEQSYEIRRLQQDSLDRYTDLDSRLSSIYQEMDAAPVASGTVAPAPQIASSAAAAVSAPVGSATMSAPANVTGGTATVQSSAPSTGATTGPVATAGLPAVQTGILTEQQLYEQALDSLLQEQQFQTSINQFSQYLTQYPDGRFVTNAYYWQGQAYVNLSMFNEARQAFETILSQYPDGRKIEDAMYSLGAVYHRLGDNSKARQMLQDVMRRFPNTSAANLADIYLRSIN